MIARVHSIPRRVMLVSLVLMVVLLVAIGLGLTTGAAGGGLRDVFQLLMGHETSDAMLRMVVLKIRLPRVLLATLVGATLSVGGLVFQALLRNPLAEPYILGISSGAGIGAILGILAGLARFPGVSLCAFAGGTLTIGLLFVMASRESLLKGGTLLLSGVMVNAFCGALIMFLISITQDARLHNIMFWLMGDLSLADLRQVGILALMLAPCFATLFGLSHRLNLLLVGRESAQTMGVNVKTVTISLLLVTSFMVSATVSHCGPVGFVGLVMPHLLRLLIGPDHRVLVPACLLAGGAYMVLCDVLARTLPEQGEMPAGVITAMIGAPAFIMLLRRTRK